MSKKLLITLIIVLATLGSIAFRFSRRPAVTQAISQKVYVALEGTGEVVIIDPATRKVSNRIDLSEKASTGNVKYMAHNVQVAPDGKSVWVTANAMNEANMTHGDDDHSGEKSTANDQVIVIDPQQDTIIKRISLGINLHLAHVVISPDSTFALAASQEQNKLYKIKTDAFTVEREIALSSNSGPHGLRIAPDGLTAYVALLSGKSLGILDLKTFSVSDVALNGSAVQTGVTPNGAYAVVSVYESKSLGVYDTAKKSLTYITLPNEAKGPVQMYPSPDSRYMYVADQGYYFDQPSNDKVYKVDLEEKRVVKSISAGSAPHGVVTSNDGKYVYVTNLLSDDVSVIDTSSDTEIARIKVGDQPNGISIWSQSAYNQTYLPANINTQNKLKTITDDQGKVVIKVTPWSLSGSQWKFDVVLDTHSEELNQDMMQIAELSDDKGNTIKPIRWEGAGPGGHHREGVLVFNATKTLPNFVTLTIKDDEEAHGRSFKWDIQ